MEECSAAETGNWISDDPSQSDGDDEPEMMTRPSSEARDLQLGASEAQPAEALQVTSLGTPSRLGIHLRDARRGVVRADETPPAENTTAPAVHDERNEPGKMTLGVRRGDTMSAESSGAEVVSQPSLINTRKVTWGAGKRPRWQTLQMQAEKDRTELAACRADIDALHREVEELKKHAALTPSATQLRKQHTLPGVREGAGEQHLVRQRLALRIVCAKDPCQAMPDCFVKITVGALKLKTQIAGGKEAVFNYTGSLEVPGAVNKASVTCELRRHLKRCAGKQSGASRLIGQTTLPLRQVQHVNVSSCDETDGSHLRAEPGLDDDDDVQEIDYPLVGRKGEPTSEVIRMQILLVSVSSAPKPLRTLIASWNVGNAAPDLNLTSWLPPCEVGAADLIAIGAQECEFESDKGSSCHQDWIKAISAAIGPSHVLVRAETLGQMRLSLWARMAVVAGMSACAVDTVATGIGNVMANKGAVAVALWIWETPVLFINAHLAAHQHEITRRNLDYSRIVAGLHLCCFPSVDVLCGFEHVVWM